jgi:hypothetical protein
VPGDDAVYRGEAEPEPSYHGLRIAPCQAADGRGKWPDIFFDPIRNFPYFDVYQKINDKSLNEWLSYH